MNALLSRIPKHFRSRMSVQWYVRGRTEARARGAPWIATALIQSLGEALDTWTITAWEEMNRTREGSEEYQGNGQTIIASLAEHAMMRQDDARNIYAKNKGPVVSHAISRWRGAGDAEAAARTGLLLDYDGGDALGWDIAWPFARIGQIRPEAGKYHIEVPFSSPVELREGGTDKSEWSAMLGWALGCLSEFAFPDDNDRLFDPLTDRLIQPINLYTRREIDDPDPITTLHDGPAVDWWKLLLALEFPLDIPIVELSTSKPKDIPSCLTVAETAIVQGLLPAVATVGESQGRWKMYMALAGALRNQGATEDQALRVCVALSVQAGVDDARLTANRRRCVWHTYAKADKYLSFNTLRHEYRAVAKAFRNVFNPDPFKGMFE